MNRIDKIRDYKNRMEEKQQEECARKLEMNEFLIEAIKKLEPRIDELLITAHACMENGIEINKYGKSWHHMYDEWERGTFVSNGISHKVGFILDKKIEKIIAMGIINGGAYGYLDFYTDGHVIFSYDSDKNKREEPREYDMKRFLKEFDAFEKAFYEYVDKTIGQ